MSKHVCGKIDVKREAGEMRQYWKLPECVAAMEIVLFNMINIKTILINTN